MKRGLCRGCYYKWWYKSNPDKVDAHRQRTYAKQRLVPLDLECAQCGATFTVTFGRYANRARFCSDRCADKARGVTPRRKAHDRHMQHTRRAAKASTDLTVAMIEALLAKAKRCPLCKVKLNGKWPEPDAPQLDHIVPINAGGSHTYSNVRVICADCNLRRPNNGSDYAGQLGLGSSR